MFGIEQWQGYARSVGAHLTAAFALVILLMLCGEAVAVAEFVIVNRESERITGEDLKQLTILRLHSDLLDVRDKLDPLIAEGDAASLRESAGLLRSVLRTDLERAREALRAQRYDPEEVDLEITLDTVESAFSVEMKSLLGLASVGDWNALRLRYQRQSSALLELSSSAVAKVDATVSRSRTTALAAMEQSRRRLLIAVPLALSITLFCAILMGFRMTRGIVVPLRDLNTAAKRLEKGDLDHRVAPGKIEELSRVGKAFNEAAAELRNKNNRLTYELAERVRAEQEILALNQRLITAQEEEKLRLGRELHDDLGQRIAASNMALSRIKRELPFDMASMREEIGTVQRWLNQLAESVRNLSHELHPAHLDSFGLATALRMLCEESSKNSEIRVDFLASQDLFDDVAGPIALCVYRVTQEALQNVIRHSRSPFALVRLDRTASGLVLTISDSGVGFSPEQRAKAGLGLRSMTERVRIVNGELTIRSESSRGTTLEAVIPLPVELAESDPNEVSTGGGTDLAKSNA